MIAMVIDVPAFTLMGWSAYRAGVEEIESGGAPRPASEVEAVSVVRCRKRLSPPPPLLLLILAVECGSFVPAPSTTSLTAVRANRTAEENTGDAVKYTQK